MCWKSKQHLQFCNLVSVAGCLGYDVLGLSRCLALVPILVSVAGCLGYDVLDVYGSIAGVPAVFQLLVV